MNISEVLFGKYQQRWFNAQLCMISQTNIFWLTHFEQRWTNTWYDISVKFLNVCENVFITAVNKHGHLTLSYVE